MSYYSHRRVVLVLSVLLLSWAAFYVAVLAVQQQYERSKRTKVIESDDDELR